MGEVYWLDCCDAGIVVANSKCTTMACAELLATCVSTPRPITAARTKCIAFGNMRIDAAVSAEVLRVISPLAIEAALEAAAARQQASTDRINQLGLALEQARYEAARARRQYDAVEPENRMVVGELERRWNERLMEVARLEGGDPSHPRDTSRDHDLRSRTDGAGGARGRSTAGMESSCRFGRDAQTDSPGRA